MTVQSWRYVQNPPIVHLTACPFTKLCDGHHGRGPLLFVSALQSNEIAAYDMNTWECRVRFRANPPPDNQGNSRASRGRSLKRNQTSHASGIINAIQDPGGLKRQNTQKNWSRRLPMHIATL